MAYLIFALLSCASLSAANNNILEEFYVGYSLAIREAQSFSDDDHTQAMLALAVIAVNSQELVPDILILNSGYKLERNNIINFGADFVDFFDYLAIVSGQIKDKNLYYLSSPTIFIKLISELKSDKILCIYLDLAVIKLRKIIECNHEKI